jgi:hypothetical protein
MGLFKQKQSGKSEINYLELTPARKYDHEFRDDGDLVNILVPKFTDKILGKYLQPKLKYKYLKADLDEFGSATWLKIDGKNTVAEIAGMLVEQFGDEIQPINKRLTMFLTQLYKSGFISFNEIERK